MKSSTNNIDISIVIVNYRSWKHLKDCLNSLKFENNEFLFEVIVVDNNSSDKKIEVFQEDFSEVKFLQNTGNNGFANGCNFGAQHSKGKYLLFLNPDTIANKDAIEKMWNFAKANPTKGIVSCEQKKSKGGYEKSQRIFLNTFTLFGLTRALYRFLNKKRLQNKFETKENILFPDWVSGSVVFISKEWLNQINGWNEDYWMYYEDMDLCRRVQNSNGQIALLKDAEIIHNHGGASRLNIKTASITKTEVLISKHVYISNHFKGFENGIAQCCLVVNNLIIKLLLGIIGVLLFFIPKMRLNVYLFLKMIRYYFSSLIRMSWLSKRSMNAK
ncbi:glycosyltransferase family 2 protein [Pseudotenacibaculum sp. MALMAid0570]|uniref:glycosyltransferase family 2 protein n=1 Tax=Pseudotenacibaculum sp. MALMAid0570 TaxID=3143938 RepID=UPI0032DEAF6F